jgi:LacI family transcriptional regulator
VVNASVKDVAARAGVSLRTVSDVLNRPEPVSPASVRAATNEPGFSRNDGARQLRAGNSRAIGLVILDMPGSPVGDDTEAGLIDIRGRGTPALLVDRLGDSFSSVPANDIAGGELAVEHPVAHAGQRIAYACGPVTLRQVADRPEQARRVSAKHPAVTIEVITQDALSLQVGASDGSAVVCRPPTERPHPVFAANNLLDLCVLQSLAMVGGVSALGDIASIGYDDIAFANATFVAPLSPVRQPGRTIDATAIEVRLREAADLGATRQEMVFRPDVRASSIGHSKAEQCQRQ